LQLWRAPARLVRLASAVLLAFVAGCALLYSDNPRFARGRTRPRSARPVATPEPELRKGTLPWPVRGTVVTPFGSIVDPKYKTVTKSSGIDVLTERGSPVRAVDSGKVSFADMFMGYGRMIILEHGNRCHSIYSKLSELKVRVGETVAKGGTMALAGDTLHFEFRVGGRSVDPLEWLAPR